MATATSTDGRLAWSEVLRDPIEGRSGKPRRTGTTFVSAKGVGYHGFTDLVEVAGPYIDRVKLAFGSTALYRADFVIAINRLLASNQIDVNPGGTSAEIALKQGKYLDFLRRAKELEFSTIEVSDGTFPMRDAERATCIRMALNRIPRSSLKSEVRSVMPNSPWTKLSGKSIATYPLAYRRSSSSRAHPRWESASSTTRGTSNRTTSKLSFATSTSSRLPGKLRQQPVNSSSSHAFGSQANLGNIAPLDVVPLEAQRRGLRSDTLRSADRS